MKSPPRIGSTGEQQFMVESKHVIDFAGEGMPAVLSTPNLVGWLERTARECLAPLLEAGERTVGIEIDLRHLAPTPMGQKVTCSARVIRVDRNQVTFQVEARDGHELIARGLHQRAVIQVENFARRVSGKS